MSNGEGKIIGYGERICIYCPKCGRIGVLEGAEEGPVNDNNEPRDFLPPEGFRAVAIGWNATSLHIFCTSCGVAAHKSGKS